MPEYEMLLQVREVSNIYSTQVYGVFGRKEKKTVLNRINLEIPSGEIFGLVSKSGCGKTTLRRSFLGFIDYEGDILIDGLWQDKRQRKAMARKVQTVFQNPSDSLNPAKRIG